MYNSELIVLFVLILIYLYWRYLQNKKHTFRQWTFDHDGLKKAESTCTDNCGSFKCYLNQQARQLLQHNILPLDYVSSQHEQYRVHVLNLKSNHDGLCYKTRVTSLTDIKLDWTNSKDRGRILYVVISLRQDQVALCNIHNIDRSTNDPTTASVQLNPISGPKLYKRTGGYQAVRWNSDKSRYAWTTFQCLQNISSITCEAAIVHGDQSQKPSYIGLISAKFGKYFDLRCLQLELSDLLDINCEERVLQQIRYEKLDQYNRSTEIKCNIFNRESCRDATSAIDMLRMESGLSFISFSKWKAILFALSHQLALIDCSSDTAALELQLLLARLFVNNINGPVLVVAPNNRRLSVMMRRLFLYVNQAYLVCSDTYCLKGILAKNNVFQMLKSNDSRLPARRNNEPQKLNPGPQEVDDTNSYGEEGDEVDSGSASEPDLDLASNTGSNSEQIDASEEEIILGLLLEECDLIGTTFTYAARQHQLFERIQPNVAIISGENQRHEYDTLPCFISSLNNVCIVNDSTKASAYVQSLSKRLKAGGYRSFEL